ncbi:chromosome partitioning protein [Glycomyces luteolus]|uniref:Chromosome partitioning protein n=1 Tax=Glycomyces luteolus TaxID=2670330 RepID=A0A9X3PG15_9ACTN|nr:chromosome partitioning protein [Glycomyces luteolus]MDA1362798.1 chromosome partitioning protein [Glycomyces luteolus]
MEHTEEDTVPLHRPDAPGWSPFAPPEVNEQYHASSEVQEQHSAPEDVMNQPHAAGPESIRNPRHGDHVPSAPPPPATPMSGPASSYESPPAQYEAPHEPRPGGNGWPAASGTAPSAHQVGAPSALPARVPAPVFPDHAGALERLGVTADDFASRRVVPPRPPVAETGLRGALHRFSLGMVALPPGPRERSRQRAVDTVRRNFGGLRQITVVNPKGGAGKTVAVLMLAMTFGGHRGGYVLAWDNNETQGTLGMRAQQDFHVRTVRDLLRDLDHFRGPTGRIGDLSQYVRAQGGAMFDVLASDESATAGEMLTSQAFGDLREAVSRFYKLIVVDTGNNVRAANWQAAIDATDQLVVTMSARNDSAETAARMLDHLEQTGRRDLVRGAVSVVSMPAHRKDVDLPAVQRHFAARTRAVLLAPYEKLLDSGEPIRYDSLSKASSAAWLRISSAVAEGL